MVSRKYDNQKIILLFSYIKARYGMKFPANRYLGQK
jgi:hypothetical protein